MPDQPAKLPFMHVHEVCNQLQRNQLIVNYWQIKRVQIQSYFNLQVQTAI